jgi:catechol-2,3-dioxygenase
MTKPIKFAHVVYMTRRYEEMIAWYEHVFEARAVHRDPALAFLTYDDEHHRFAIINLDLFRPGVAEKDDRGEIGVNHVAYTYATAGDLLENYARLKEAGITPYWPVHHGTTMSLYYADPDGNRMELQVDVGTVQEATALMATEAFAANPVGVRYDPDMLLAEYRSGATNEALLAQRDGPPTDVPPAHGIT